MVQADGSKNSTERHCNAEAFVTGIYLRPASVNWWHETAATALGRGIGHRDPTFDTKRHCAALTLLTEQRQAVFIPEATDNDHYKIDQDPDTKTAKCKDHKNPCDDFTNIEPVYAKRA